MADQADLSRDWVPDACTLPAADRPARAAAFARLLASAVGGVERPLPTRLRLGLRPGPEAAAEVAALAAAETGCCSFFTFTMTLAAGSLTLDVTVPEEHAGTLDALARAGAAPGRDT